MPCKRLVHLLAVSGLCLAAGTVTAAPTVFTRTGAVTNLGGNALTASISFSHAFVGNGNYSLKLSMAGSFADGDRDGAAVTPLAPSGHLTEFSLATGQGVASLGGAGAAASFVGAGGTAGEVRLDSASITNLGSASLSFSSISVSPPLTAGRVLSQGAVAGVTADGATDGVSLGPIAGTSLSSFGFKRSGGTDDLFGVNDSDSSVGPHGSVLASGSQDFDCATPPACVAQQSRLDGLISGGGDAAAFVLRHEFGGDPINGTVIDLFDEDILSTSFSCAGAGGCTSLNSTISFTLTAGDLMAFVIRMEINEVGSVPAPGGLASLFLVAAGAGLAHRRRHFARRRSPLAQKATPEER